MFALSLQLVLGLTALLTLTVAVAVRPMPGVPRQKCAGYRSGAGFDEGSRRFERST